MILQSNIIRNLHFEKAYCQYRLNQPQEALKTIEKVDELDHRLKELKAQVLYRLENYMEAFQVYEDIVKNVDDDYSDERETNLGAVLVQLAKTEVCINDFIFKYLQIFFSKHYLT